MASGSPRLSASRAAAQKSRDLPASLPPRRTGPRLGLTARLAAFILRTAGSSGDRHARGWRFPGLDQLGLRYFEVEQARRVEPQNIAFGRFIEEWQRRDRIRQVEIPVR